MLIIAIPKSASTSLMSTLGELHSLPYLQFMVENEKKPDHYSLLSSYHSDIREISEELVAKFANPNTIFKQHIAPTENNTKLLRSVRKIILLRETHEIIEAYFRGEKNNIHHPRKEFKGIKDLNSWKRRASEIGLKEELDNFHEGWLNNSNNAIVIYYKDLINDPAKTINKIENFYDLAESDQTKVKLSTERYSRISFFQAYINKLKLLKNKLFKRY